MNLHQDSPDEKWVLTIKKKNGGYIRLVDDLRGFSLEKRMGLHLIITSQETIMIDPNEIESTSFRVLS